MMMARYYDGHLEALTKHSNVMLVPILMAMWVKALFFGHTCGKRTEDLMLSRGIEMLKRVVDV